MKLEFLFALLLMLSFSLSANSQDAGNRKSTHPPVSENVMREIVRRILVYKFKAANRQKVIYLVKDGIDQSWLPVIPNIEFRLLSDEELQDRKGDVYFFSTPKLSKKTYAVNFAFGDPDCNYSGESWRFRNSKNKVSLWQVGGVGGGCSGSASGEFKTPGQLNTYPNELKGYQFFNQGKLKDLKLSFSTREAVEKNFGADCEIGCDYNDNWKIRFSYFGTSYREKTINDKKIKYVPKEELVGTIYSIELIPKQYISFIKVVFPYKFNRFYGGSVGDDFDDKGNFTSAIGTSYTAYLDRYGLTYKVYESGYTVGNIGKVNHRKGNLIGIEYTIPEMIEETMFVEQQSIK